MAKDILKRYSETFKHQVVREYEAGASVHSLQQQYGITGSPTIKNWINKYSHKGYRCATTVIQTAEEHLEFEALKARSSELESALAETVLENRMLHTPLDVAGEALNLDLKKFREKIIVQAAARYPQVDIQAACVGFGITRQAYYQARWRQVVRAAADDLLLNLVRALRYHYPRMGVRKLCHEL